MRSPGLRVVKWLAASVIALWVTFNSASAFHIIGGEITYDCLGLSADSSSISFNFGMKVYRDCSGMGADFDSPAEIGVYREINGRLSFVRTVLTNIQNIGLVPVPDNPCLIVPNNVCVQEGSYQFTLSDLPVINGSYHIFWRRCCRNQTINNIRDPRNTGAMYTVEITAEAQRQCNNSPRFKNFPPTVICVNEPLTFDHGAFDTEGDQLVYEFCAPLEGGGPAGGQQPNTGEDRDCDGIRPDPQNCPPIDPPVTFIGPAYTPLSPLGGSPLVEINTQNGRITGTPEVLGQFVVGVCVKEYRNGQLMSILRRDFQFNVSMCEVAVLADIQADTSLGDQRYVLNSCGQNTITFVNLSELRDNIISYNWEFDMGGSVVSFDTRDATVTFPGVGAYNGTMIVNEGLSCSDTADISVNIYPDIGADFEFVYDTCFAAPVEFTDKSFTGSGRMVSWDWQFGDGNRTRAQSPSHLYPIPGNHEVVLTVQDINRCVAQQTKLIPYFPVPPFLVIEPSTFNGCTPANILFNNLSIPIDSTYDILWDFGDGTTGREISPTHLYIDPGVYSVVVDITSPIGCRIVTEFPNWIRVRESPVAGFDWAPEQPNTFNPTVTFQDESENAHGWQWLFGDEGLSFIQNPTHTFQDSGLKTVEQVVIHENGCADTAYALIDIIPEVRFHLPNAFTPNNDSKNDVYRGVGIIDGIKEFEMTIWSRWGELVFESQDPLVGWNGKMNNTGEDMPIGVYVAKVEYVDPRRKRHRLEEFATLVR